MITLGVIAYIIISIRMYYSYKKDNYSEFTGEWDYGQSKKLGMIYGFSFVPIVAASMAILIGVLYVLLNIVTGILWLVLWIATNMP
ncbi:membrane protein [Bacillus phage Anthos]|uniref:Membrane protein n=1 Tax=Bacillus phage Anthos TaxID=2796502 RepID=A0A7U3T959_9CAUD|nr:membrane protein [Bacillus phage Anthos]